MSVMRRKPKEKYYHVHLDSHVQNKVAYGVILATNPVDAVHKVAKESGWGDDSEYLVKAVNLIEESR